MPAFIQKLLITGLIYLLSFLVFTSCEKQTSISEVKGDVQVLIPEIGSNSEKLVTVKLKNIENLSIVSGSYVKFFYSPGSGEGTLVGEAPHARFIRTKGNVFIPSDVITQQMFTLYYHVQELTDLSARISPELNSNKPFAVGLNTKVVGNSANGTNNAFYDGTSDALLVVPYSLNHIPIAINSGIIAHEFFHSIFYKKLLQGFNSSQELSIQGAEDDAKTMDAFYFNQTLIRGINEGVADFWGWLYTGNSDFINSSLPEFGADRKLELDDTTLGKFEQQKDIEIKVSEAQALSEDPSEFLSGYIYKVGTPHARFLKQLTIYLSRDGNIELKEAQLKVAKAIYKYMKKMDQTTAALNVGESLLADDFFAFMANPKASGVDLTEDQCDFVVKYIEKSNTEQLCKGTKK